MEPTAKLCQIVRWTSNTLPVCLRSYLVLFLKFIASVIPTIECGPSLPACMAASSQLGCVPCKVMRTQQLWFPVAA